MPVTVTSLRQLPSQPQGHWHGHWHSRQLEHRGTAWHRTVTPVTLTGTANLNTEALPVHWQPLPPARHHIIIVTGPGCHRVKLATP